jgi:hypothetical protein
MKARIKWVEDRTFIGECGSGHKIVLGTAFGPEGRSPGPSPMELVLIGPEGPNVRQRGVQRGVCAELAAFAATPEEREHLLLESTWIKVC